MAKNHQPFDKLWKGILEDVFGDFLRFFFPEADELFQLDTYEFLDNELQQLNPENIGKANRVYVDKLAKVQARNGEQRWFLVHVEVQGYPDQGFPERMFRYFYRILDRYRHPVTAIVVFTGPGRKTPDRYLIETLGTRLEYRYNVYRIADASEETLKANIENPFAQIVLAARTMLMRNKMTDNELMERHEWVYATLSKTLPPRRKMAVLGFISSFVRFSNSENYRIFDERLKQNILTQKTMGVIEVLQEEAKLKGIVIGEKKGEKRGEKKGVKKATQLVVRNLLLQSDFSLAKIAEIAGVSLAFVRRMKKELNPA